MKPSTRLLPQITASILLVLAGMDTISAWAAPESNTVTRPAPELQAKADYYAHEAAYYRARAVPGSKQMIIYFTMANRFDQLAQRYHLAAVNAAARG